MSEQNKLPWAIFNEAIEIADARQRADYLASACGDDMGLRQRIEGLLEAHFEAGRFMGQPDDTNPAIPTGQPGDRIGRYKLLQKIGEGGCGVVYMAEQEEPVRRHVAIKVIKIGMDTKSVIARFEAERQALALMDHPNIAKVFDAGATETGRPYFVMELVKGVRITEYCDENNLSTTARLDLFTQVCNAIQHAHQKGVIHRDIKPSNILVTLHDGVPVPKVIDFGIAKATNQQWLTDMTPFTALGEFIGTPAYMSPEQAEMTGLDVDTRSDIYALGVLLYELLIGKTPFDGAQLLHAGLDQMRRIIREEEPPKPSTRLGRMADADLTVIAQHRQAEPNRLIHLVRGDLDWIVMKALEKDRSRRYESATSLAHDIARHLNHEPVVARPPTKLYRFQKMVRRNKLGFAAAGAVVAALLIGLIVSSWLFFKESKARQRAVAAEEAQARLRQEAESEAQKSRQIAVFLKDMLRGVEPSVALGRDTTLLREIVDKAAERVSEKLGGQPAVEATLRDTLGAVYFELGDYSKAEAMARESLALRRKLFGNEHSDVAGSLSLLGAVFAAQAKLPDAEIMHREALTIRKKVLGNEHSDVVTSLNYLALVLRDEGKLTEAELMFGDALVMEMKLNSNDHALVAVLLANLAGNLLQQGKLSEAEAMQRQSLEIRRKLWGNEHPAVATSLGHLARVLDMQGKLSEAEAMEREVLTMNRKLRGGEHPDVALSLDALGGALYRQGKLTEAETMHRDAVAMQRKLLGSEHPHLANSLNNLAVVLEEQGRLAEAEAMSRDALTMRKKAFGNEHSLVANSLNNLASILKEQKKLPEAEAMHREALTMNRKLLGNEHPEVANSLNNLATVLAAQDRQAEAETMHRDALAMERKFFGDEHPRIASSLNNLAMVLAAQGKLKEAETMHRDGLAMDRKLLGNEHPHVAASLANLASVLEKESKFVEAESMRREALVIKKKQLGDEHPDVLALLNDVAVALMEQGKLVEAEAIFRDALTMRKKVFGNEHPDVAGSINNLVAVLVRQGKSVEVEGLDREALAIRKKHFGTENVDVAMSSHNLATFLTRDNKFTEAEPLHREALATRRKLLGNDHYDVAHSLVGLGILFERQGKYAEAEPFYLEANRIAQQNVRVPSTDKRGMIQQIGRFYTDWAATAPGTGKMQKSLEWGEKLIEFDKIAREQKRDAKQQ